MKRTTTCRSCRKTLHAPHPDIVEVVNSTDGGVHLTEWEHLTPDTYCRPCGEKHVADRLARRAYAAELREQGLDKAAVREACRARFGSAR